MSPLIESIQSIPWSNLIGIALLTVIGVILWGGGRRTLKPGLAATGLLIGATLGSILGGIIDIGVPPWVIALLAGLAAAVIALIFSRLAVTGALALILGLAGPLIVRSVNIWMGSPNATPAAPTSENSVLSKKATEMLGDAVSDEFSNWLDQADSLLSPDDSENAFLPENPNESIKSQLLSENSIAGWTGDLARETWNTTPETQHRPMIAASIAGILIGILLGVIAPRCAATTVTASGGAILWLYGVRIILMRIGLEDLPLLPETASLWLILWVIISLIGIRIQRIFRPERPESPAP